MINIHVGGGWTFNGIHTSCQNEYMACIGENVAVALSTLLGISVSTRIVWHHVSQHISTRKRARKRETENIDKQKWSSYVLKKITTNKQI